MRDAAFISIGLLDYSSFAKGRGMEYEDARVSAHKINIFNCGVIEKRMDSIDNAIKLDLRDPEFFKLKNHIPARVGRDKGYYRDQEMDDNSQNDYRSALIQYDTVPLVLHALYKEYLAFGLDLEERGFLNRNINNLLSYLGKVYITECADMWEMENNVIHSYDVAAIHSAFQIAKKFSDDGVISMSKSQIEKMETGLFEGGPIEFLKKSFIESGVIYREKDSWTGPTISKGVDSAEIYMFTMFGINDRTLGMPGVESATINEIKEVLFSSNVLPIRFLGDKYFTGGRWLNVGAEYSVYLAGKGDMNKAKQIIDYIIEKYGDRLPEQELVNPASPHIIDYYLIGNGNKVIEELSWSYAAMISATTYLLDSAKRYPTNSFLRS